MTELTDQIVRGALEPEEDDPLFKVKTAAEVANRLGCSRQGADKRLRELREQGDVGSRMSGNARLWWLSKYGPF